MAAYWTTYVIVPLVIGYIALFWCHLSFETLIIILIGLGAYLLFLHHQRPTIGLRGKAVIITGCDSGFGHALAQRLDALGSIVFAGCQFSEGDGAKSLERKCSQDLSILQLDITQDDQIQRALNRVQSETEARGVELWGLVNNAGLNVLGEVEFCTMKMYRQTADVNLFGTILMTKSFLPLLKKTKGRIIIVTSIKGRQSLPANSAYNITKWGLTTFAEILRMEMRQWGVSVVIVEPGNFGGATGMIKMDNIRAVFKEMWDSMETEQREAYGKEYVDHYVKSVEAAAGTACFDLTYVVNDMVCALSDQYPKARYVPGGSNGFYDFEKWLMLIGQYVPTELLDLVKIRFSYKGFPKPKRLQSEKF